MFSKTARKINITIILSLVLFVLSFHQVKAQSSGLDEVVDMLSDSYLGRPNVSHMISFKLPRDASNITPSNWIIIDLPNFTGVTIPINVLGEYSGTPIFSVDGTTVKITGITVVPGGSITIVEIYATNPLYEDQFGVSLKISLDEEGLLIKNYAETVAAIGAHNIFITTEVGNPSSRLLISGYTAPTTYITFSEYGPVVGTDYASGIGYFAKLFSGLDPDTHKITLHGVDTLNRTTSIVNVEVYTPVYQTTNVTNILLSPTIEINTDSVNHGDIIQASGSAYPSTLISLFTDTPVRSYVATTSATGFWTTEITNTDSYVVGDYRLYAMAQTSGGLQSLFSPSLQFSVISDTEGGGTACGDISHGDFNCDGQINLIDFSILMFYWGQNNATADINQDDIVSLTDFSILMFYWGS